MSTEAPKQPSLRFARTKARLNSIGVRFPLRLFDTPIAANTYILPPTSDQKTMPDTEVTDETKIPQANPSIVLVTLLDQMLNLSAPSSHVRAKILKIFNNSIFHPGTGDLSQTYLRRTLPSMAPSALNELIHAVMKGEIELPNAQDFFIAKGLTPRVKASEAAARLAASIVMGATLYYGLKQTPLASLGTSTQTCYDNTGLADIARLASAGIPALIGAGIGYLLTNRNQGENKTLNLEGPIVGLIAGAAFGLCEFSEAVDGLYKVAKGCNPAQPGIDLGLPIALISTIVTLAGSLRTMNTNIQRVAAYTQAARKKYEPMMINLVNQLTFLRDLYQESIHPTGNTIDLSLGDLDVAFGDQELTKLVSDTHYRELGSGDPLLQKVRPTYRALSELLFEVEAQAQGMLYNDPKSRTQGVAQYLPHPRQCFDIDRLAKFSEASWNSFKGLEYSSPTAALDSLFPTFGLVMSAAGFITIRDQEDSRFHASKGDQLGMVSEATPAILRRWLELRRGPTSASDSHEQAYMSDQIDKSLALYKETIPIGGFWNKPNGNPVAKLGLLYGCALNGARVEGGGDKKGFVKHVVGAVKNAMKVDNQAPFRVLADLNLAIDKAEILLSHASAEQRRAVVDVLRTTRQDIIDLIITTVCPTDKNGFTEFIKNGERVKEFNVMIRQISQEAEPEQLERLLSVLGTFNEYMPGDMLRRSGQVMEGVLYSQAFLDSQQFLRRLYDGFQDQERQGNRGQTINRILTFMDRTVTLMTWEYIHCLGGPTSGFQYTTERNEATAAFVPRALKQLPSVFSVDLVQQLTDQLRIASDTACVNLNRSQSTGERLDQIRRYQALSNIAATILNSADFGDLRTQLTAKITDLQGNFTFLNNEFTKHTGQEITATIT